MGDGFSVICLPGYFVRNGESGLITLFSSLSKIFRAVYSYFYLTLYKLRLNSFVYFTFGGIDSKILALYLRIASSKPNLSSVIGILGDKGNWIEKVWRLDI
jgi:hypothetical protein